MKLDETTTYVSPEVVNHCEDLRKAVAHAADDDQRTDLLTKLVWAAMKNLDRQMAGGISTPELLLAADIIGGWALRQIADQNKVSYDNMQRSWILALAYRYQLLNEPAAVERSHAEPVN